MVVDNGSIVVADSGLGNLCSINNIGVQMKYFLNEDKTYRSAELMEWAEQFETMDRHVGNDIVHGKLVSTVWLGLDHSFHGDEPLVFETMIFSEHKPRTEIYMKRYSTWDEAAEGHQKAIEWVKKHYI
jgi:hypothetical protein